MANCQHANGMQIAGELSDETADIIKANGVTAVLLREDVLMLETEKGKLSPHDFFRFQLDSAGST